MDAIHAFGIAEARGARGVLGAVEHRYFPAHEASARVGRIRACNKCDRRIERGSGFPSRSLWRKDRIVRGASPGAERQTDGLRGEGKRSSESSNEQRQNSVHGK